MTDELTDTERARARALAQHPERRGTKQEVIDDDGEVLIDSWGYYTVIGRRRAAERAKQRAELAPLLEAIGNAERQTRRHK